MANKKCLSSDVKPKLGAGCKLIEESACGYLYDYSTGAIKVLNLTGLRILSMCDGRRTIKDIITELNDVFFEIPEEVEQDVLDFINEAVDESVLSI